MLEDGIAEAFVGKDADDLASELGIEVMRGDESGTDLIVVAPDLDGSPDYDFASHLRGAVLWNLWPKLVSVNGERPHMRYSAEIDGSPIELPEPGDWNPTKLYVDTYRRMLGERGGGNPTFVNHKITDGWGRVLGNLGIQKGLMDQVDFPGTVMFPSPPRRAPPQASVGGSVP